jgi:hypothetical protein
MPFQFKLTWRSIVLSVLFIILLILFVIEVSTFAPSFLDRWINDYDSYVLWGNAQRLSLDQCSPQASNYYPMPSTLWVFIPLSLMPRWFVLVFMFAPLIFPLLLFKKAGAITWLYYPMLVQSGFGQIDGWLIVPLYWLVQDIRWLAGIGAVLVLFKPQLAIFAVGYMVIHWLVQRNWRNLGAFAITLAIVYIPSFFICPTWPLAMLRVIVGRTSESNMATRGATLWAWVGHGDVTFWLLPIVALGTAALLVYVFVVRQKRAQAAQIFGLLTIPVLYVSSYVMLLPILKTRRHLIIITMISWVGVVIDTLAGGWGGAYVIIPITALILLAREDQSLPHPSPQHKLRAQIEL